MLLITGITGHSGSYFLQELIQKKYAGMIRCIVRENSDTTMLDQSGLNTEKIIGDLDCQEFMDKCMGGVDTIVHIASIFYSLNVMKAAVKSKVNRVILVHTTGIYSKYKSASEEYKNIEFGINKILKERNSSIGLVYLRPTMIYGNIYDKNMVVFIKMVDKLRVFPVVAHGEGLLQPVNGRDLGKAYYQLLTNPDILNGDYILSGEKPTTMLEIFTQISNDLGKKTTFVSVPLGLSVFMARSLKLCTFGKIDYIEKVLRMVENRSYLHDTAFRDFGYDPMSFEEGLNIEIKQYQDNKS